MFHNLLTYALICSKQHKRTRMKQATVLLYLLLSFYVGHTQTTGSITTKQPKPKAGATNLFIYTPPKNLFIPEKVQAVVIYQSKQQFFSKTIPVNKVDNRYQFSFKAPDSTAVLIFGVTTPNRIIPEKNSFFAEKKTIVDNNEEKGFIIPLYNNNGNRFYYEKSELAALLNNSIIHSLDLKETPNLSLIKLYEDSYKLYPSLKNETSYLDYLFQLYSNNEKVAKPKLLTYVSHLLQQNDEDKWATARSIYGKLKMADERKRIDDSILVKFPDGKKAKENFWSGYYTNTDKSEKAMLTALNEFKARFKDSSEKSIDIFYTEFLLSCIENKDTITAFKYELLVTDKNRLAFRYDRIAWKLSGKETDNPGKDLDIARRLSEKAIAISCSFLKDTANMDEDALNDFINNHYQFYDNYALVLHKLKQHDSAFHYQNMVSKQGKELNNGGIERFAAYAEKVKGAAFTKQYIEEKLFSGVVSPVLLKQLQSLYAQLNLPEDEFSRMQHLSLLLSKQKSDAAIIERYGTIQAPDFSLKNMAGETVTLSQLKSKVVILDFWSTWCSPCIAAFPAMQELVNKYKDDKNIVFLFIDTWENDLPINTQAKVKKYMQDNKYSFNVLFDEKKKVVTGYKVEGIPKKVVIDKNGNLVFTDELSGIIQSNEELVRDLIRIIEAAKKIPFIPNINNTKLPNPVFSGPKNKQ